MANNAPDSSAADPAIQIFGIAGLFEMCHSMIEIFAGGGGGGGVGSSRFPEQSCLSPVFSKAFEKWMVI